jgi:CO/xanthine dehydrogenase Mo-binding subunit
LPCDPPAGVMTKAMAETIPRFYRVVCAYFTHGGPCSAGESVARSLHVELVQTAPRWSARLAQRASQHRARAQTPRSWARCRRPCVKQHKPCGSSRPRATTARQPAWAPDLAAIQFAVLENIDLTQIAEVTLDRSGQPRIERVVCAVDCGVAVNPDMIRAQMEGDIG